jgi:16S rRNA (uracil1498-N3)-methyltransferase
VWPGEPIGPGDADAADGGQAQARDAARRAAAHVFVADLEQPELDPDDVHHLTRVLRLRPGEALSVSDGDGGWRSCQLGAGGALEVVGDLRRFERRHPQITVGFAPGKGDRPEWAVQKLTEAGVERIVLLRTERSVVRWDGERARRHLERLSVVARQAAMQSRQLWLPQLRGPMSVEAVISDADYREAVALATPGGGPPSLGQPCVLVGPEGGWSPDEERSGPPGVALGSAVLRTETAALAAGVLLAALRDGLVQAVPNAPFDRPSLERPEWSATLRGQHLGGNTWLRQ